MPGDQEHRSDEPYRTLQLHNATAGFQAGQGLIGLLEKIGQPYRAIRYFICTTTRPEIQQRYLCSTTGGFCGCRPRWRECKIIGVVFDKLYLDGAITNPPLKDVQTLPIRFTPKPTRVVYQPSGHAMVVMTIDVLQRDDLLFPHSLPSFSDCFRTKRLVRPIWKGLGERWICLPQLPCVRRSLSIYQSFWHPSLPSLPT